MPSRKTLLILVAFLVAALLPATAEARKSVRGPGYKTFVPSGWKVKRSSSGGWHSVIISSPGTRKNVQRGSNVLSIGSISAKVLRRRNKGSLPTSPVALAQLVTAVPSTASNINLAAPPQAATLAGAAAGSVAYTYDLQGTTLLQTETAVRRGGRVYVLQVTSDSSISVIGASAINMARQSWRWR
ncbi:MAG: hypothetical protein JWR63_1049 [Conexibacter sp.]|nr:hypothetical protein [Conexibacter sp.]